MLLGRLLAKRSGWSERRKRLPMKLSKIMTELQTTSGFTERGGKHMIQSRFSLTGIRALAPRMAIALLATALSISHLGAQNVTWLASFNAGAWSGNDYVYNWLSFTPQMAGTLTTATSDSFSCTNGSCTGPAYYVICLVNPGTGVCPSGSTATSDATYGYSISPIFSSQQFTFSGTNQITLAQGQTYYVEPYICCDSSQALAGGSQSFLGFAAPTTLSDLSYGAFGYGVQCGGEGLVCFGGAPTIFAQCNNGASLSGLYFGEYNIDNGTWYGVPVGSLLNGWYAVSNPSQTPSTFGGYGPNAAYFVGFGTSLPVSGHDDPCSGTGLNLTDALGTITVSTNLAAATFTILGPSTYSGNGTSASFTDVLSGSYTINFGAVSGYTTPPPQTETVSPGGTISFVGNYSQGPIMLTSITGWHSGCNAQGQNCLVVNAEWTGQPKGEGSYGSARNIYDLFYAIDACQNTTPCIGIDKKGKTSVVVNPQWQLLGSNFCPPAGCTAAPSISFSDPAVNPTPSTAISSWNGNEIVFTPSFTSPPYDYTANSNVSVTITRSDGVSATLPLPTSTPSANGPALPGVVATINGAGYGQCTWYVANTRLAQILPIPVPPYYKTDTITANSGPIDENYIPQQWDVLDFFLGSAPQHTAIITTQPKATPVNNPDGSVTTTYAFTIGEMNVGTCNTKGTCQPFPWSEQASTAPGTFAVNTSAGGIKTVQTEIYSYYCWLPEHPKCAGTDTIHYYATNYFRGN